MRRAGNAGVGDGVWVWPCARCGGGGATDTGSTTSMGAETGASFVASWGSWIGGGAATVGSAAGTERVACVAAGLTGVGSTTSGATAVTVAVGAAAAGAGAAAGFWTAGLGAVGFSAACGCSSLGGAGAATTAGGLTATAAGGGATTTTGRGATTAPAGGLAMTVPTGGREAMAGGVGGATTMGGADLGWGTILRGSGRATAGVGAAATGAGVGAGRGGATTGGVWGRIGAWLWRASSSSFCLLAKMALRASPGLEIWERSILGWKPCGAREDAALEWPPDFVPRNCARTLSAS